ncbi:taste receptor type 2 member 134-like [Leptodactylus fuscus]|uniref:taste receptor type 2 member 134-like n=1 Tax=Leptodactylus fuscus TaxID=238119 RepID=UPI003F4EC783
METESIASLLLSIITSSSAIYLHVFISVVSYRTWLTDGFRHPQGLLFFCLGLSSTIFEGYQLSIDISLYFWPPHFSVFNVCTIYILYLFTFCIFFNMCQTSWLCSFYCISLVSGQHWIIRFLKSRLSSMVPWIVAGTLVMSGIVLISLLAVIFITVPVEDTDNTTFYCRKFNETYIGHLLVIKNGFNILMALPFCLILVSLSCTVSTLVRHMWRVRRTLSMDRSHLEAHIQAAKTMILLLALNTSFYLVKLLEDWTLLLHWNLLPFPGNWLCQAVHYFFWPLQALTLIFRNKKLYRNFLSCPNRRSSEEM